VGLTKEEEIYLYNVKTDVYETKSTIHSRWRDWMRLLSRMKEATDLPTRLDRMNYARSNLVVLRTTASSLEQSYIANAANLNQNAADSDSIKCYSYALAVCYLMVAVGKVSDAIAQFTGAGKYLTDFKDAAAAKTAAQNLNRVKFLTSVKTPVSDTSTLMDDPNCLTKNPMAIFQSFNLVVRSWGYNTGLLKDADKSLLGMIDIAKDILSLIEAPADLKAKKGELKKLLPKLLGAVKNAADMVSRVTSLIKEGKGTPLERAANIAKYVAEAVLNFCDSLKAFSDALETADNADAARGLAGQQLAASSGGFAVLDLQKLASLQERDRLNIIYTLNSASDAHRMAEIAERGTQMAVEEIKRLNEEQARLQIETKTDWERMGRYHKWLKSYDNKLEEEGRKLAGGNFADDDEAEGVRAQIEETRENIAWILNPQTLRWPSQCIAFVARGIAIAAGPDPKEPARFEFRKQRPSVEWTSDEAYERQHKLDEARWKEQDAAGRGK
jgi:hypothetical protein